MLVMLPKANAICQLHQFNRGFPYDHHRQVGRSTVKAQSNTEDKNMFNPSPAFKIGVSVRTTQHMGGAAWCDGQPSFSGRLMLNLKPSQPAVR